MNNFVYAKDLFTKLSLMLAMVMAVQTGCGLLCPHLYHDTAEIIASWRGNDFVTMFMALPVLLGSIYRGRQGSAAGKYTWISMVFYAFYNNCYYLFGAALNGLFLVYVAICLLSVSSILIIAANYATLPIETDFVRRKWLRLVSVGLIIFGSLIGGLWMKEYLNFIVFGIKPTVPGMDDGYQLVAAMDFTIQFPVMFIGAYLMLKNKPLGYLLSYISAISNTVYIIVLLAFSPFAAQAGLPKAWDGFPLFSGLLIYCWISAMLFYQSLKKNSEKGLINLSTGRLPEGVMPENR